MSKPPIFHPYTTNTGQTFLRELVAYPRTSMWLRITSAGGGIPASPLQIEMELEESILLVHSDLDILVGLSSVTIPTIGTGSTIQPDTILLRANHHYILQWPSQYFTPIPLNNPSADAYIFINTLSAQNSSGDPYKLDNR